MCCRILQSDIRTSNDSGRRGTAHTVLHIRIQRYTGEYIEYMGTWVDGKKEGEGEGGDKLHTGTLHEICAIFVRGRGFVPGSGWLADHEGRR